jgi:hypothetical protein
MRCLRDLGLPLPQLDEPLWLIQHPLIAHMQKIPGEGHAGGAEPIRSLNDRRWWKCKTSGLRGIVTQLTPAEFTALTIHEQASWW